LRQRFGKHVAFAITFSPDFLHKAGLRCGAGHIAVRGNFMRAVIVVASLFLLTGCSDMPDSLFNFDTPQEDAQAVPQAAAQPAPQQTAAVSPNDSLCRAVAQQDATGNGFDQPTQQRVAQQSYAQCMALHGQ
jgi:uncharacterized lipoprotein YajG